MIVVMRYSQNGWSVDWSRMASFTVPDTKVRLTLRKGDASVLLLFVAERFDKTVEKLIPEQCGGYNDRSVIGARVISNHGSGCAEDLNWSRHARGKRNTFTPKQITAVREILAVVNRHAKVVRWGEDYVSAPVDGMHFEVIGTPAQTARAAADVRAWRAAAAVKPAKSGAKAHKPGSRDLRVTSPAMSGEDVEFVQRYIGERRCGPADGWFGAGSKAGVAWYQQLRGLPVTEPGVVNKATWREMGVTPTY